VKRSSLGIRQLSAHGAQPASSRAPVWLRLALLSVVVCATSGWQTSVPLTSIARTADKPGLLDVYRSALADNADYQAALARYRAAIEAKPQARSRLLPRLNATASYDEIDQSVEGEVLDGGTIDRSESFDRKNYGLTLSQPLYQREAFIGLEQADVALQQARLALLNARSQLAMRAATAYFGLLDARNRLAFVRAEKRAIQQQLSQIQDRAEAGLVANADLKAAQAQYDLSAADEISAENAIEVARTQLKGLTGRAYRQLEELPAGTTLPPLAPQEMQPWIDAALQYNTALRRQRANTRMADLGTDAARAGRWPRLNLVGSYRQSDQSGGIFQNEGLGGANENENASIGVNLSVPIFNGGLVSSRVRQATANHDEQVALQTQQRVDTVGDTRTALLNIRKDKARVKALDKAIESATAAANAAKVGYDVGNSTSADVLSALRDQYRARRDYALARSQYLLDLLELNQLAGQLDKQALAVIDRRLQ